MSPFVSVMDFELLSTCLVGLLQLYMVSGITMSMRFKFHSYTHFFAHVNVSGRHRFSAYKASISATTEHYQGHS